MLSDGNEAEIPQEFSNTKNSELTFNRIEYELMHGNLDDSPQNRQSDEADQDAAHMMVQSSPQSNSKISFDNNN